MWKLRWQAVDSRQSPQTFNQSTNYQLPISTEDKVIQTTKLRQAIGRRLVESKQTIPHFYVTHEYKMEAVMEMRKQINAYLATMKKSPSTTSLSKLLH
jgi:pyruvate/2-oxoglutarate dehydrogenase complex dihydrolipoamide acyltransferase (E2) component